FALAHGEFLRAVRAVGGEVSAERGGGVAAAGARGGGRALYLRRAARAGGGRGVVAARAAIRTRRAVRHPGEQWTALGGGVPGRARGWLRCGAAGHRVQSGT